MNALTEEAVLPTLHNLILAEVYLSGGPVDVFRLWSEMYERQKTIDVGTLLFVRAIAHLEENGFLQKVSESKSAITGKGEAYLIALLLAGSLSDEALDRLAESGLKLASTGNILDVADRATGNAPVTDGLQVGDEGVGTASRKCSGEIVHGLSGRATDFQISGAVTEAGAFHSFVNSFAAREPQNNPPCPEFPTDERYADNISRFVDSVFLTEQLRLEEEAAAEEGAAIEASGYPDPAENVRFA